MKAIPVIILVVLCVQAAIAQKFKDFRLKVKLDKGWSADAVGGGYPWEEGGSLVCACSALTFEKRYDDGTVMIVIYPSTKAGLDSVKRQRVGNRQFIPVESSEPYTTPFFTFTKKVSELKETSGSQAGQPAWRYEGSANGTYYLIYVFESMGLYGYGPPGESPVFVKYQKDIEKVINAIQPL